jgi:hypothetical protein
MTRDETEEEEREESGAGDAVCAGGVGRPSKNLDTLNSGGGGGVPVSVKEDAGGVSGGESGATGWGNVEPPVCTLVLRFVLATVPVFLDSGTESVDVESTKSRSVSGGGEPVCASVLRFERLLALPLP